MGHRENGGRGELCESFREKNQRTRRGRGGGGGMEGGDGGRGWTEEKTFSKPSRLMINQFFINFGFLHDP